MIEHVRQEPNEDPSIKACKQCRDIGVWRFRMHGIHCPAGGESIPIEDCTAVENARHAAKRR